MDQEGAPDAAISRTDRGAIDLLSLDAAEALARELERDVDELAQQMLASSVITQLDVLRAWVETERVDDRWGRATLGELWSLADGLLRVEGLDQLGEAILRMLDRSGIRGQPD